MATTSSRVQSLARFVPLEVLRQLARQEELIPRQDAFDAAVLFADISGFTRLSERLGKRGPAGVEELTRTLNDYFGELIEIVISSGGDIVKFAGDALLAVWRTSAGGTPTVRAAAECGLAAQSRLRDRKTQDGDTLSLRIGIGTGIITSYSLGGELGRWEFVVSGESLLEATQAADAAERGDVVLGPRAAEQVGLQIQGQPLSEGRLRLADSSQEPPAHAQEVPDFPAAVETEILKYVPAAIHQRLDVGHANWLGKLRRLTVLFVNLPNLDHQTPLPVAQKVMATLQSALYRYEGSVNKMSADDKGITFVAAMGLPPLAHEDDALRGVLTAWDIQSSLAAMSQKCSIGVTSGRVFCGIIGNIQRCEYTMIGDVVNLSARLMQSAGGGILCDHATFTAACRQIDFETLAPLLLKGKSEPVPVYRPCRKWKSAGQRRSLSPMIGREKEQRQLNLLQQNLVEESRGSIALVDGEPGIGKSRLVASLRESAKAKKITTFLGAALDIERSTPYFAWRGVFRKLFELDSGEDDYRKTSELAQLVVNQFASLDKPLELIPLLNPVLAMEVPDNSFTAALTQEARVTMTNELLKSLLQQEAREQPIQIILEDCHWMDSASWTLTRLLAESAEDFLLFIITRPLREKPPGDYLQILEQAHPTQISLKPLGETDVETLVCRSLGVAELPRQVADLIRGKAQGNPLFSEELAFALRDAGVIEVVEGRCVLTSETELANLGFPDTVQGVVTSRIDRLVPSEQLTLKVASVVGRSFSCKIMQDIFPVENDRPAQRIQLQALSRRDLITAHDQEQELDYQFRHVITQEVAYDMIPPTQRQELHRSIAEWYEQEYGDDLSPFFALLAKHWSRTDQTAKALEYLEKSGEGAAKQFANAEAVQFFLQAIQLNDSAGGLVPAERRAHWERQVAEAHYNLGDLSSSLEHFRSTLVQLRFPLPRHQAGSIGSTMVEFGKQFGLRWLTRLFRRLSPKNQTRILPAAQCYERLAQVHYLNNSKLQTIHAVFKALNLAEAIGPSPVLARCYANASVIAGLLMMHRRARFYAARSTQVAEEVNDPDCTSYVGLILGIYWVTVGEWEETNKIVVNAVEIAERLGARRRWAESAYTYLICSWRRGDLGECQKYAQMMREAGRRDRVPQIQVWGLTWWLRCLLAQSEAPEDHRPLADELAACLKHEGIPPADQILGHGVLAAAYWRLGEAPLALEQALRASQVIAESNQISHYVLPAYSGIFMVYSGLWTEEIDPTKRQELEKHLKAVRRSLWEYGMMYPVGRVRDGLHKGQDQFRQGQGSRAMKTWRKAVRLAKQLRMPLEEGLLHRELALHGNDPSARKRHEQAARELFEQTGARYHLSTLDRMLSTETSQLLSRG